MKKYIIILFFTIFSTNINSQEILNLKPKQIATLSAIMPGLGQVINKKYYKPPIIYAGLGLSIYFIYKNNLLFNDYKTAYLNRLNNTNSEDSFPQYNETQLLILTEYYNRNRDVAVLTTCVIYLLNIIDAYVDGHLINFNVNENLGLSIKVYPELIIKKNNYNYMTVCLKF